MSLALFYRMLSYIPVNTANVLTGFIHITSSGRNDHYDPNYLYCAHLDTGGLTVFLVAF